MIKILRIVDIGVMRAFCAALALGSATIFSPEALAQTYPTKQIRLLVTTAPGAGPDIVARLIGGKLTEALGQQIIVDNRTGASGRIATEIAARAAPDGYTLMMMQSDHTAVYGVLSASLHSVGGCRIFSSVRAFRGQVMACGTTG